jgi:hypothetical protein
LGSTVQYIKENGKSQKNTAKQIIRYALLILAFLFLKNTKKPKNKNKIEVIVGKRA